MNQPVAEKKNENVVPVQNVSESVEKPASNRPTRTRKTNEIKD